MYKKIINQDRLYKVERIIALKGKINSSQEELREILEAKYKEAKTNPNWRKKTDWLKLLREAQEEFLFGNQDEVNRLYREENFV